MAAGPILSGIGRALQTFVGTKEQLEEKAREEKRQQIRDALLQAQIGQMEANTQRQHGLDERELVQSILANLPEATDVGADTVKRIGDAGYGAFTRTLPALQAKSIAMPGVTQEQDLSHGEINQALPFIPPAVKAALEATRRAGDTNDARTEAARLVAKQREEAAANLLNFRLQNMERLQEQGNRNLDIKAMLAAIAGGRANNSATNASARLNEAILARVGREALALYPPSDLEKALGEESPERLAKIEAYKANALKGLNMGGGGMNPVSSHEAEMTPAQKAAEAARRARGGR